MHVINDQDSEVTFCSQICQTLVRFLVVEKKVQQREEGVRSELQSLPSAVLL